MRVDVAQLVVQVEEAAQAARAAAGRPVACQHELVELQVRRRAGPVQQARPGQECHGSAWYGRPAFSSLLGLRLSEATALGGSCPRPPAAQCPVGARAGPGVLAGAPPELRTRGPCAPAPGRRLGTRRAKEGSAFGFSRAGAPQGRLAAAVAAAVLSPSAAGRTGAARRGWGRQAPPRLLAPAIPPAFRALGSGSHAARAYGRGRREAPPRGRPGLHSLTIKYAAQPYLHG